MDLTGIVIRNADIGDSDKLVTVATPQGLVTARAKGVRKASSKLKSAVVVLSFGEFSLAEGKAGFILNGANITESFHNCWTDPDRYAAAMLCLEAYEKLNDKASGRYNEGKDAETLGFVPLLKALRDINYGETYPPAVALKFALTAGVEGGLDIDFFPEEVRDIFHAIYGASEAEEVLVDANKTDVKKYLMHLAAGFRASLGISLTVAGEIFRM